MSEKQILEFLAKFDKRIERHYDALVNELARIGSTIKDLPEDGLFSFKDYPVISQGVKQAVTNYAKELQKNILDGAGTFINLSYDRSQTVLGAYTRLKAQALIDHRERTKNEWYNYRMKPERGMSLSDRVWNYSQQARAEFEAGMSEVLVKNIAKGISAEELGRQLRNMLKNPDMMYRRYHVKKLMKDGTKVDKVEWRRKVVDDDGKVHFVKQELEHTGRGVYRSARKNALRLAATEINMAYRYADYKRWIDDPCVIGFEILLSENHTCNGKPFHDMCDDLQGRYPKWFLWTGWHVRCRCNRIPILISKDELRQIENLPDEEYNAYISPNLIMEMPDEYNEYVSANKDKIADYIARDKQPYWIRDNYVDGDIAKGLKALQQPTPKKVVAVSDMSFDDAKKYASRYFGSNTHFQVLNNTTSEGFEKAIKRDFDGISRSVDRYASMYAAEDKTVKQLYELYKGTDDYIEKRGLLRDLQVKCSLLTKEKLEKMGVTKGLEYVGCTPNFTEGYNGVQKVGRKEIQIKQSHYDLVTFKDKHGQTYSYPIEVTKQNIKNTIALNVAAKSVDEYIPKFLLDHNKGFVFIDADHPLDPYYRAKYKNFERGAMYSSNPITVHTKFNVNDFGKTAIHEIGHHIYHEKDLEKGYKRAVNKDIKAVGKIYPTEYSKQATTEDFAESIKMLFYNKDWEHYMRTTFANRITFMRKNIPELDEYLFMKDLKRAKSLVDIEVAKSERVGKYTKEARAALKAKQKEVMPSPAEFEEMIVKGIGSKVQQLLRTSKFIDMGEAEKLATKFVEEQVENHKKIADLLHVKQGKRMTFTQADSGKNNPNYYSAMDRIIDNRYKENCSHCVFSHELRMRGFDVEAKAVTYWYDDKGRKRVPYYTSGTHNFWLEQDGSVAKYEKIYDAKGNITIESIKNSLQTVGRYDISVYSNNPNHGGHIFCVDVLPDKSLRVYDPQRNRIYDLEDILSHYDVSKTKLLRVDNKLINKHFLHTVKVRS